MPSVVPAKVPMSEEFMAEVLGVFRATEFFTVEEVEWLESILTRPDQQDGFRALTGSFANMDGNQDIIKFCRDYLVNKPESKIEQYTAKVRARDLLFSKQVSMYRQKRVMILAPQRKQHAKYPAPNLAGLMVPQHISAQVLTTYGLDYVAARNTLLKQALADQDATHALFVDDDVLLPRNALQVLVDAALPVACGWYCKKSPSLETATTAPGPDAQTIFNQKLVPYAIGDMAPRPTSATGGGMMLIDLEVVRKLPEPWFSMILGTDGNVIIGEDSFFTQRLTGNGVKVCVIPGLIGLHCDFATGDLYAPPEIVDPVTRRLRPEFKDQYLSWPSDLDTRELMAADVVDYFGKNKVAAA
jgi:hypothetical protein